MPMLQALLGCNYGKVQLYLLPAQILVQLWLTGQAVTQVVVNTQYQFCLNMMTQIYCLQQRAVGACGLR